MLHRMTTFIVLALLVSPVWGADDPFQAAEARVSQLRTLADMHVRDWRYKVGQVENGQDPALDDSAWAVGRSAEFTWGEETTAWLRLKITIPADVGGMPVAGRSVTFKCSVDDGGIIYVNGRQVQEFLWDSKAVVLTESAKPGESYLIAIKGNNTGGPGRLLSATLEYSGLEKLSREMRAFVEGYFRARQTYGVADEKDRAPFLSGILDAVAGVNLDALKAGREDDFISSLKSGEEVFNRVGALARGIDVYLVGHAHIDMNWLWLWPETVDVCKNTFSTAMNLMQEFPGFRFSQSQPATYLAMQELHPDVFARIKDAVKRGQWDVTATTWTEGDLNMSSGESIVRSILYGKRYMKQQFGVESVVCWEPDTFGHPWTIPQILAKSGIKYYYFCRCNKSGPVFWWQSPDGSRVLACSTGGYNSDINDGDVARDAMGFARQAGIKETLRVYGVGDHGGGPTRAMLNNAVQLQSRTDYAQLKFSSARGYFESALKTNHSFPVWDNELNTTFEGCYTTHADIKRWNRESESLIPCAEKFSLIAADRGGQYPASQFEQAWRNTGFNQFHDLLCGSAIHDSYIYSKKLFEEAKAGAEGSLNRALDLLASRIATDGPGVPIVVYNPLSWTRTDAVEVPSPFAGEDTYVRITDAKGNAFAGQNLADKLRFTARDVPSLGYKVFWANRAMSPVPTAVKAAGTTLENEFFRVVADPKQGLITEVYDKRYKRQVLLPDSEAVLQVLLEERHGMSAWNIGPIVKTENLAGGGDVDLTSDGPARAVLTLDQKYGASQFVQEVALHDGVPRIDINITADWQEVAKDREPTPMLKAAFPLNVTNGKATFEIPFGSIERPANGAEVPAQKWIDLSEPDYGVSLLNDCKYGFDVNKNTMRATLLRASYDPDPIPDRGIHEMTLSLYPHKGDWRLANTVRRAYELNEPLVARVVGKHRGTLPKQKCFVWVSEPNLIVTALKKAEDDGSTILRLYETHGKSCKAKLAVGLGARYVVETDLMERPIGKRIPLKRGGFTTQVGKYEIKTFKLMRR